LPIIRESCQEEKIHSKEKNVLAFIYV